MKFKLEKEQYDLLKTIDFAEIKNSVTFYDDVCEVEVSEVDFYGKHSAIALFQVIISEEIVRNGLTDDQEDATPLGRKLYALYDEIYYQIPD